MIKTHTNMLIFDMDGLMVDTERMAIESWEICLKKLNLPIDREFLISLMGTTKFSIYSKFDDKYGKDFDYEHKIQPQFAQKKMELIIAEKPENLRKKGLIELINFAKENGLKIAVASSSTKDEVEKILKKAEVIDFFDFIICGDEVKNGKPDPEIFLKAVEKAGVSKENTIILEDSTNGLLAAYNAGIKSIFVKDIVSPPEEVLKTVWKKADSLIDVIDII